MILLLGLQHQELLLMLLVVLRHCQKNNISTACIVCNENSPLSKYADFKIEVIVGPEFLTGSSRLESWNCTET
jgi:N-acetylmuramic acid 6-phosphate etherase